MDRQQAGNRIGRVAGSPVKSAAPAGAARNRLGGPALRFQVERFHVAVGSISVESAFLLRGAKGRKGGQ
jgi:hypothetical protein